MARKFTSDDLRALLASACAEEGGQKYWAARHGVSAPYVSDVLNGRREPGESICSALGFVRKVTYEPMS